MKKINFFKTSIVIYVLIFLFSVITYAKTTQKNIADSVLRLHIVANSDSEEDQLLKLKVRDRILEEGAELFEKNMSLAQTEKYIEKNIEKIRGIAEEEIRRNGYSYNVKIETGEFPFPAKIYENIMLPSGRYRALKLIIGDGDGENWWCVMYPPMCSINDVTVKRGKEKLEKSLSGEEFRIISGKNPPAEIRFKIVDLINSII